MKKQTSKPTIGAGRPASQRGRYLKYAIGEIVLVIIGILIALQVNNLNEKRKVTNDISSKINDLVINLEDEIKVSGLFHHPKQIENIQKLLDGDLNPDHLNTELFLRDPFSIRFKDDILEESIDVLIENENLLPKRYKILVNKMKSLKFHFSNYKEQLDELHQLIRNNEKIMEDTYPWYSCTDSLSNEKRLQYFTTDPFFRNRLYSFQNKYRRTYSFYSLTIGRKLEILCAVKQVDENYAASQYRSYLKSLPVNNFTTTYFEEGKKVSCNTQLPLIEGIRSSHILVNTRNDTISYTSSFGTKVQIAPQTTAQVQCNSKDLITIFKNNACEAYSVTLNNFIIIE
jgi:hypothetical protein